MYAYIASPQLVLDRNRNGMVVGRAGVLFADMVPAKLLTGGWAALNCSLRGT